MTRTHRTFVPALTLLAALQISSSALLSQQREDPLTTLMDRSGLSEQLVQFEKTMLVQLREGIGDHTDEPSERVEKAVRSAYSAKRMQQRIRSHLEGGLSGDEIDWVLDWLASPLGERITRLEEEASTPESYLEQNEIADFLVENIESERLERYRQLDEAVQVSELTMAISVNTLLAVAEGIALVAPDVPTPRPDQLRQTIEAQRERMTDRMRQATLRSFAYTYRDLEHDELDRYIEFAESPVGRKYHEVVSAAFERALSQAGRDLGLALGSSATS